MKRISTPFSTIRADESFWESVCKVMAVLVPTQALNLSFEYAPDYRKDMRMRLIAKEPYGFGSQDIDDFLSLIVKSINSAPDSFIPSGKLLYHIGQRQFVGPIELLDTLLCNIRPGSDVWMYTAQLRQTRYSLAIDTQENNDYFQMAYIDFIDKVNVMYQKLRAYVKRHRNQELYADLGNRITIQAGMIEALWLYYNHNEYPPIQSPVNFQYLKMIDDTLFYSDTNSPISKSEFTLRASSWPLNSTIKSAMISMIQDYQSFLYQHRKDSSLQNVIVDFRISEGIVYDAFDQTLCLYYDTVQDKFVTSEASMYSYFKLNYLSKEDFMRFSQSENANLDSIKALFHLTNGNTEQLDELARLSSYICSTEKRFSGAICLLEKYKDWYLSALSPILLETSSMNYPGIIDLHQCSLNETVDNLIKAKINKDKIICCTDNGERLSKDQKTRLSKVIRGVTITIPDSILRRKKHKNITQFIVFGTERTVQKLVALGVPCFSPSIRPTEEPFCCSQMWLKVILPLWGTLLDEKVKLKNTNKSIYAVDFFLKDCCEITNGKDHVEARILYNLYQEYCKNHEVNMPLLFKDFNAYLEKNLKLKRKQLHKSEHKSPTVFYGIRLLDIDKKHTINTLKTLDNNEAFLKFFDYAFRVFSEVYKRFDIFPFEKAIDDSTLSALKYYSEKPN